MASNFSAVCFKRSVDDALKSVERILEKDRNPRLAEDVDHEYVDKFGLTDLMTNAAIIAQLTALERLGWKKEAYQSIDQSKPVTLRFDAKDSCSFITEETVELPVSAAVETTETTDTTGTTFDGTTTKSKSFKVVKHVQEFHYEVNVAWELSVYNGTDVVGRKILDKRSSTTVVVVQSQKRPPLPAQRAHAPIEVSLTWLLGQIDKETLATTFSIDTHDPSTCTPRRNKFVDDALANLKELQSWAMRVVDFFHFRYKKLIKNHNPARLVPENQIQPFEMMFNSKTGVFVPVQPLMESTTDSQKPEESNAVSSEAAAIVTQTYHLADDVYNEKESSALLSIQDMASLLGEQARTLKEKEELLIREFPSRSADSLLTVVEATICVLCAHIQEVTDRYLDSVQYVETMLENQLVAAIGKSLTVDDIDKFVHFHNAKLMAPSPASFCYAIRRPEHFPEGTLSIESNREGKPEPIETHVREVSLASPIKVPLTAACQIELTGKAFLHGWSRHRFGPTSKAYELIARARQFSSFLLVVGTMSGPSQMQPKDAIILQNKDTVKIPLLLDEIPTAKEFKNAIGSLSPEQQRFAKAFRAMQLESSVLGVCVIQIKPQLEEVLRLPPGSLTKKMKLTQDLMELFVEHQVPSDMLSLEDDSGGFSVAEKVATVEAHTKAILDVIAEAKKKQLEEQSMVADMADERAFVARQQSPFPAPATSVRSRGTPKLFGDVGGRSDRGVGSPSMAFASSSARAGSFFTAPPQVERAVEMDSAFCWQRANGAEEIEESCDFDHPGSHGSIADAHFLSMKEHAAPQGKGPTDVPHVVDSGKTSQEVLNFAAMPKMLDAAIEQYAGGNALRSTNIKTSDAWVRDRQENLLTRPEAQLLHLAEIKSEKEKAFDLLDGLSRSGTLPIATSELHVIVCVTHSFEKDIMSTIVQDNVDPICKLEMSTLLLASTIHGVPMKDLIADDKEQKRLLASMPTLLED